VLLEKNICEVDLFCLLDQKLVYTGQDSPNFFRFLSVSALAEHPVGRTPESVVIENSNEIINGLDRIFESQDSPLGQRVWQVSRQQADGGIQQGVVKQIPTRRTTTLVNVLAVSNHKFARRAVLLNPPIQVKRQVWKYL
jgi:hypothetical protein